MGQSEKQSKYLMTFKHLLLGAKPEKAQEQKHAKTTEKNQKKGKQPKKEEKKEEEEELDLFGDDGEEDVAAKEALKKSAEE